MLVVRSLSSHLSSSKSPSKDRSDSTQQFQRAAILLGLRFYFLSFWKYSNCSRNTGFLPSPGLEMRSQIIEVQIVRHSLTYLYSNISMILYKQGVCSVSSYRTHSAVYFHSVSRLRSLIFFHAVFLFSHMNLAFISVKYLKDNLHFCRLYILLSSISVQLGAKAKTEIQLVVG